MNDLLEKKIARESEGAVAIFSDVRSPRIPVSPQPRWRMDCRSLALRKSDGGFNYTTTDLATLDFRLKTWSPEEIVYVVDDRQFGHFKKLFLIVALWKPDAAKTTKFIIDPCRVRKILGDDGKPFKTRSGETVKLADLLDEAEDACFQNCFRKKC